MSHWITRDGWYQGSQLLQPISTQLGLQLDKLNYIVAGFTCILVGTVYRDVLHPSKVTPLARKLFNMAFGMAIVLFCFGGDIKHMLLQTAISYILMKALPLELLPKGTLFFNLFYQSIVHAIRMYYDYEGYTLDITGALMMLTQRLTSLAFSLRDGRHPQGCTPSMLADAVKRPPDLLTYFTYAFNFHMILCGPLVPFNEFLKVTNGDVFKERMKANNNVDTDEPNPKPYVTKRAFFCLCHLAMVIFVVPNFQHGFFFTPEFAAKWFPLKLFWYFVHTALTRQQYYVIWKLSEAICNSSNYGYRFVDGKDVWDGCTNVNVFGVETAKSQRDGLAAWNTSTQRWLRNICYDRVATSKTLMTFFLSATWHGFYPGYYLTFMTLALQTIAARHLRRTIRPYFQDTFLKQKLYDVLTFLTTLVGFAYATVPFILLSFNKTMYCWSQVYFSVHILTALVIFALPKIVTPEQRKNGSSSEKIN